MGGLREGIILLNWTPAVSFLVGPLVPGNATVVRRQRLPIRMRGKEVEHLSKKGKAGTGPGEALFFALCPGTGQGRGVGRNPPPSSPGLPGTAAPAEQRRSRPEFGLPLLPGSSTLRFWLLFPKTGLLKGPFRKLPLPRQGPDGVLPFFDFACRSRLYYPDKVIPVQTVEDGKGSVLWTSGPVSRDSGSAGVTAAFRIDIHDQGFRRGT